MMNTRLASSYSCCRIQRLPSCESSGGTFDSNLSRALASDDFIHSSNDTLRDMANKNLAVKNRNTRVHKSHFLCHRTVITHILQLKHKFMVVFSPLF